MFYISILTWRKSKWNWLWWWTHHQGFSMCHSAYSTCNPCCVENAVWSCTVLGLPCADNSVVMKVENRWLPAGMSVELSTQPLYLGVAIRQRYFFSWQRHWLPLRSGSVVFSSHWLFRFSCVGQRCFGWWVFTRAMAGWMCARKDKERMDRWLSKWADGWWWWVNEKTPYEIWKCFIFYNKTGFLRSTPPQ